MLVLFETPAGFALFKVLDEGKLSKVEDLSNEFETPEAARKIVKLKAFDKFENTTEALGAACLINESKSSKSLRKFLSAHCQGETLAIADSKLGNELKEKLKIDCVHNQAVMELMRGVRSQLTELIAGLAVQDLAPMSLGLSHSLSRYKLKFSPEKVDTMIIQAIGLLDDLDKELNTYAMRVREWYGWHFPELTKIVQDNILYAKAVKLMGNRVNAAKIDFSELETRLRVLEGRELGKSSSSVKGKPKIEVYDKDRKKGAGGLITAAKTYNPAADAILSTIKQINENGDKDQQLEAIEMENDSSPAEAKKGKKEKKRKAKEVEDTNVDAEDGNVETEDLKLSKKEKKKKKKEEKQNDIEREEEETKEPEKTKGDGDAEVSDKKKKKRKHAESDNEAEPATQKKEKKKKKKSAD